MEIEKLLQQILSNQQRIESKLNQLLKNIEPTFVPPTLDDIRKYMEIHNISPTEFTAEYFYQYYSAKDWQLGKQKMSDWQKVVDNWHEIEQRKNNQKSKEFNASDRKISSEDLVHQYMSSLDNLKI